MTAISEPRNTFHSAAISEPRNTFHSARHILQTATNAPGDTVLLMGQTGGGKSSLANAILNLDQGQSDTLKRAFPEGCHLKSVTEDLQVRQGKWFGKPSEGDVTVIDTPGLLDSENRTSEFLVGLLDLLEQFPPKRLRLIVITLPLTEQKANSSYTEMLDIVDGLFRPDDVRPIWEHVMFVNTCANLLASDPILLKTKRDGWREFLIARGVEDPHICEFEYGNPESLVPLQAKFESLEPYTPKATTEMTEFVKANPYATVEDKIKQNETWRNLQEDWARKLEEAERKHAETIAKLKKIQKRSKMQEVRFAEAQEAQKKLEAQIVELRNRPPQIEYRHAGGCLTGTSTVWVRPQNGQNGFVATRIKDLTEGQLVATLDDSGSVVWSDIYFVDIEPESTLMLQLTYTHPLIDTGHTQLTPDHIVFVDQAAVGREPSVSHARPIPAAQVKLGDILFASNGDLSSTALPCEVTSIGTFKSPDMCTVLVRQHRLLIDSVLISSHVVNHEWGVADNAIMLFLYDHVSASFVTSPFNKWFCRQWDSIFEPLARTIRDTFG